jgi:hypothetical protein
MPISVGAAQHVHLQIPPLSETNGTKRLPE